MMNDELSFRRFVPTEARIPTRLARGIGFSWAKPSCYEKRNASSSVYNVKSRWQSCGAATLSVVSINASRGP